MTMRLRFTILLTVLGLVAPVAAPEARAAEPRLVRVVLLRVADRMSLALEMTAEPEKAALRMLSDRALEVEAGPVSGLIREEQLAPGSSVPFIRHVSIQKYTATNRSAFIRARLTFDGPGDGNVRVVGRMVYIDFIPALAPRPRLLPPAPRRQELPQDVGPTRRTAPPPVQRTVAAQPAAPSSGSYEQSVRPLVARLTEIGPFLASAVATPADDVLAAVSGTLAEVEQPLRTMDVPQASRPIHNILLSAVATAGRAVALDFKGDRVAQAQRALALLDAARSEIR